jgi:pyruvate, water dikinase
MKYIKFFSELDKRDNKNVGGKNASLGEMIKRLGKRGVRIPNGFATTAKAYWFFLDENNLREPITGLLEKLDTDEFSNLNSTGSEIRKKIMAADMPDVLEKEIKKAYKKLVEKEEGMKGVAVRSSATAEDLPTASFAGQHDSFLNIEGEDEVVKTVQKCMASLFTDRAIKYRIENEFDHMKVALSAGVQRMVRADEASAGVMFTIEPESGHKQLLFISGSWGLGENVVQGNVQADQFYVFKPSLKKNLKSIIRKTLGSKAKTMVYSKSKRHTTRNTRTPQKKREIFVLNDDEIKLLAFWGMLIEEHYKLPMDVEWAKDANTGELFIVQARPETVHSKAEEEATLKTYTIKKKGKVLATGMAIGDKITSGKVRILDSPDDSGKLEEGDVLVTESTNPDWDIIMKKASSIVTNSGGRTSHAAIVARELGAVAVVGAGDATKKLTDGETVTVSCAEGDEGKIYKGELEWEEDSIDLKEMKKPKTEVMLILGDPSSALKYAAYPVSGVGLMRLEFIISNAIHAHPLALLHFDKLRDKRQKSKIQEITSRYTDKRAFFVDRLSEAVATIASAFYPRDVIVRMSDFKSNEYAGLLGGKQFEPDEENPMLGFRGASRYYNKNYVEGFGMECEAMKVVRDDMGLTNVKLMIPFCRTVEEGKRVLQEMEKNGLKQGWNNLEIYMMVELPSNVLLIDEFAKIFDGFSIGSNDLTQLTMGLDRDSAEVSHLFDEQDEASKKMIEMALRGARKAKRKIGLCGQAPSDFSEFARFLVKHRINSISFNPDAVALGIQNILKAE